MTQATFPTIGTILAKRKGVGPGFDFLRVTLALSVVAWHTMTVTGNIAYEHAWVVWFPGYAILAMFFSLSGFLISASAQRLKLRDFLINRSLRIVPALFVEIALSAFILGPIFTLLPLGEYFTSAAMWHYFSNVVGLINYHLPGVFEQHPDTAVNNSLWTIPFEIGCYAIISIFVLLGAMKRPALVLVCTAAFLAAGFAVEAFGTLLPGKLQYLGEHVFTARGSRLFAAFLLGIAAYLYRDRIPYRASLAWACAGLCLAVALMPEHWFPVVLLNALVAPALVYLTAFLGVSNLPTLPLFDGGDYSYGIYLYGFPIQQATVALLPDGSRPLTNLLLATPFIVMFAMASWHFVEKPILKLRRRFSFMAKARLESGAATQPAKLAVPAQDAG